MEKMFEDEESLTYRLQCRCGSPEHAEDISLELEQLKPMVAIGSKYSAQNWRGTWKRLRDAWKIVRGQEILVDDFTFREEDLRPVGEFFLKVANDYDQWKSSRGEKQ